MIDPVEVELHFNPLEQDEENYQYQHENINHFIAHLTECDILQDL